MLLNSQWNLFSEATLNCVRKQPLKDRWLYTGSVFYKSTKHDKHTNCMKTCSLKAEGLTIHLFSEAGSAVVIIVLLGWPTC